MTEMAISEYFLRLKKIITFKRFAIVLVVVLIIGFLVKRSSANNSSETLNSYIVANSDVVSTLSVDGKLRSKDKIDLVFGISGFVKEINFKEGDIVHAGDLIAAIDTTQLEAQLLSARGALLSASSNYSKTNGEFNSKIQDLNNQITELDQLVAQSNLETNKAVGENSIDRAEIATDIADVNANAADQAVRNTRDESEYAEDIADINRDDATTDTYPLVDAQGDLSEAQYDSRIDSVKSTEQVTDLQADQSEIDLSTTKLNTQATIFSSQVNTDKLQKSIDIGKIQKDLLEHNRKYDLGSISGQIMQAKASVTTADYNIKQGKIIAPFDGKILSSSLKIGEYYGGPGSSKIQLINPDNFVVEAEINELDIFSVKVGQKAIIEFEADPNIKIEGKISEIKPAAIVDASTNVVSYKIEIEIPKIDGPRYDNLSVRIDIVKDERQNVLSVPAIAVDKNATGAVVKVRTKDENGKETIEERKVILGLESDENIEILEGLSVGEEVVY